MAQKSDTVTVITLTRHPLTFFACILQTRNAVAHVKAVLLQLHSTGPLYQTCLLLKHRNHRCRCWQRLLSWYCFRGVHAGHGAPTQTWECNAYNAINLSYVHVLSCVCVCSFSQCINVGNPGNCLDVALCHSNMSCSRHEGQYQSQGQELLPIIYFAFTFVNSTLKQANITSTF